MDFLARQHPLCFFVLLWLCLASLADARILVQERPAVVGRVLDAQTREPLAGTNIIIIETNGGATTMADGTFELHNLDPGIYTITASFVGYHKLTKQVRLKSPHTISGRIVDDSSGTSLAGVTVRLQNTDHQVLTDSTGFYSFSDLPVGTYILEVLSQDHQSLLSTITVGPVELDFALRPDVFRGEEIVVTGIASRTSRSVAPVAVSRLPASDYTARQDYRTAAQLINGKVAGVQVRQASGNVGGGFRFDMRAGGGLNGDGQPLIYVDGIRVENAEVLGFEVGGQGLSLLADLTPAEIENIEILKGPAGAVSYGTNGANGVVLITTKRGKYAGGAANSFSINYKFSGGLNTQAYQYNSRDYLSAAAANDIFTTGTVIQNSIDVSGGSGSVRYFAAFDSRVEEGILKPNEIDRKNVRANFDVVPNDRLTFRISSSYSNNQVRRPANDNNLFGYLVNTTIDPVPFQFVGGGRSAIENIADDNQSNRFVGSMTAEYSATSFLSTRLSVGIDDHDLRQDQNYPLDETYSDPVFDAGVRNLFTRRSRLLTYTLDTQAQVSLLPDLGLSVIGGLQLFDRKLNTFSTQRYDFLIPLVTAIDAGAEESFIEETSLHSREAGIFSEFNLSYLQRYFLSLKLRRDYATAIGRQAPSVFYPGVSAAARLDDLASFPDLFSLFKIRAAYGETGILPDPLDAVRLTFRAEAGGYGVGGVPASIGNPGLKPERVKEFELGLDAEILNRLAVELTYYRQNASNSIFAAALAPSTGLTATPQPINAGSARGWGFETLLQASLIRNRNLDLTATLISSWQDNEVTAIGGALPIFDSFGLNVIKPELARHEFYLEPLLGALFNSDGTYAGPDFGDERVRAGNPVPQYTGSLALNLRLFRNFNFYFLADWAAGHKIWNGGKAPAFLAGNNPRYNLLASQLGIAGTGEADGVAENVLPVEGIVPFTPGTAEYRAAAEDFARMDPFLDINFIEDADFLKLRELSVSYSFRDVVQNLMRPSGTIKDLVLTFSATNVLTATKYSGPEVEVNWSGARALERGQDYFTLQMPRSYNLSLRISL